MSDTGDKPEQKEKPSQKTKRTTSTGEDDQADMGAARAQAKVGSFILVSAEHNSRCIVIGPKCAEAGEREGWGGRQRRVGVRDTVDVFGNSIVFRRVSGIPGE